MDVGDVRAAIIDSGSRHGGFEEKWRKNGRVERV